MVKQPALQLLIPSLAPQIARLFFVAPPPIPLGFRRISAAKITTTTTTTPKAKMATASYAFGPYEIDSKEVFYTTPLSFAFVNLRPVVPDVLVCPRREVKRVVDLTADEISDMWTAAQKIGGKLETYHEGSSLTFTIQDGPQAGQTVPHVHIHILPRKVGDFENNDEIYDAINGKEEELKRKLDLDKERKDRSFKEMAQEAEEYRKLFS